jgi:hypothetical protein
MAFLLAKPTPLNVNHDNDRFSMFNKKLDIATQVNVLNAANKVLRSLLASRSEAGAAEKATLCRAGDF